MQFLKIPNLKITPEQEKELVEALKKQSIDDEAFYKPVYDLIRRIRAAKNCENYEKPVQYLTSEGDNYADKTPNIHIPDLKNAGNVGIAEIERALYTGDYLTVQAVNPEDKQYEELIKSAMYSLIEQTNTDKKNIQIAENIWYEGTCPVVITNEGRINTNHEIIYRYEIPITTENEPIVAKAIWDFKENALKEKDPIGIIDINPDFLKDLGKKISYKQETISEKGEEFTETKIQTETGHLLNIFHDLEETGQSSIEIAEQFLEQIGIDLSKKEEIPEGINSIDEWIEGFPRPKILNLLDTCIESASSNEDEDTLRIIYKKPKKTEELYSNPEFIQENKEKLKENGKFIGKTNIDITDKPDEDKKKSYKTSDPHVIFRQAYFYSYQFKDGTILRNFICSTADDKILLECKPNLSYTEINGRKFSQNPFILYKYYSPSGSNIGRSPAMDMIEISKALNILFNTGLDKLSRSGNRWTMDVGVDIETYGSAGAINRVDLFSPRNRQLGITNANQLVIEHPANTADATSAFSQVPFLEAKLNQSSNTSQNFFNDKNNQTATEIAATVNQASGIIKSVINNIAKTDSDVKTRMFEDCVNRGVVIDLVSLQDTENGTQKIDSVDFSKFKGKKFLFKLSSTNPELTSSIIANTLKQLLTEALNSQNPEIIARFNVPEITQEVLKLSGITNPKLTRDDAEAKAYIEKNDIKEQLYQQYIAQQEQAKKQQDMQQQIIDSNQKKQMSLQLQQQPM